MRPLAIGSLVLLWTCLPRFATASQADVARSFAEWELSAERAKDDSKRRELEAERDTMAKLWCKEVSGYVRRKLDARQFPAGRLVAWDGLDEIGKHPALGICRAELEAMIQEATREELTMMDADGRAGHPLRAVERGKSLQFTRPGDDEVQRKLQHWQQVVQEQTSQEIREAQQADRAGAELFARRIAEVAGAPPAPESLKQRVLAEVSRHPQYSMSGAACAALQPARLPAPPGVPLPVEIAVEKCVENVTVREGMEPYTYEVRIPYTYEASEGEDCSYDKERHFGKSDITGKMDWVETTTRKCTPRRVTKTGYKSETKTGERLVKHRVTSLELRGQLIVSETGERLTFETRDSFDDQQYESPQSSRAFSGEGPANMAKKAAEAITPLVEGLLARENVRKAHSEVTRATEAFKASAWLDMQDALVHAAVGSAPVPAELVAVLAERHHMNPDQARSLLSSSYFPSELPTSAEPIARIPKAQWTVEKDKLTNDRATEHFAFAQFSLLYGRPKGGKETGRYGLTLGGMLHSPVKSVVVPSLMTAFRLGLDHEFRVIYDLHAGLGAGSLLGPLQLRAYGVGGFDRVAMGDHYELPSAWTYGGEGHLDLEITRFKSIGLEGALLKRTSGPDEGRLEKRIKARIVVLGEDLTGFSIGASLEDYGVGRVYGIFVGSD